MHFETYDEWRKLFDIHERFGKHSLVLKDNNGDDRRLQCTGCGAMFLKEWYGDRITETYIPWEAQSTEDNLVHVIRRLLEKGQGQFILGDFIAHAKDEEGIRKLGSDIVEMGADAALAYATRFNDYSDEFFQHAKQDRNVYLGWLIVDPSRRSDATRSELASLGADLAYAYATQIDKCPHESTARGVSRNHEHSLKYAREFKGQLNRKQMKYLRKGCCGDVITLDHFYKEFGGKINNEDRKHISKRKYQAYTCATQLDPENILHPAYKKAIYSLSVRSLEYHMIAHKGKASAEFEREAKVRPWEAVVYQLVHGKDCHTLRDRYRNRMSNPIYVAQQGICEVDANKMTRAQALKKSRWALAYMFLTKSYEDEELQNRAMKNSTYNWLMHHSLNLLRDNNIRQIAEEEEKIARAI